MHSSRYEKPYFIEKLVSALSYLTSGLVGFIWLLLGVFTNSNIRPFMKYHIFQSIFLAITYFLVCQLLGMFAMVISYVPFINNLVLMVAFYLNMPLILNFSIIQILISTLIVYLVITSMQGKYSYLPWISDIIKMNVRN